jgi:hypothetical protein
LDTASQTALDSLNRIQQQTPLSVSLDPDSLEVLLSELPQTPVEGRSLFGRMLDRVLEYFGVAEDFDNEFIIGIVKWMVDHGEYFTYFGYGVLALLVVLMISFGYRELKNSNWFGIAFAPRKNILEVDDTNSADLEAVLALSGREKLVRLYTHVLEEFDSRSIVPVAVSKTNLEISNELSGESKKLADAYAEFYPIHEELVYGNGPVESCDNLVGKLRLILRIASDHERSTR